MPMRTSVILLFLSLLTACARPRWAHAVAAADPAFGGGDALEWMLRLSQNDSLAGDPLERTRFLREQRILHDAAAVNLVLELTSESAAVPALEFLRSDAGNAFVQAEIWAVGLYPHYGDDLPQQTADRFSDAAHVADAARADIAHASQVVVERSGSVSPAIMALTIGAARLTPEQADAIGAFFTSEDGERWIAVRTQAFARTLQRLQMFRAGARARGFIRAPPEDLEDLILPRHTYDPGESAVERRR